MSESLLQPSSAVFISGRRSHADRRKAPACFFSEKSNGLPSDSLGLQSVLRADMDGQTGEWIRPSPTLDGGAKQRAKKGIASTYTASHEGVLSRVARPSRSLGKSSVSRHAHSSLQEMSHGARTQSTGQAPLLPTRPSPGVGSRQGTRAGHSRCHARARNTTSST